MFNRWNKYYPFHTNEPSRSECRVLKTSSIRRFRFFLFTTLLFVFLAALTIDSFFAASSLNLVPAVEGNALRLTGLLLTLFCGFAVSVDQIYLSNRVKLVSEALLIKGAI